MIRTLPILAGSFAYRIHCRLTDRSNSCYQSGLHLLLLPSSLHLAHCCSSPSTQTHFSKDRTTLQKRGSISTSLLLLKQHMQQQFSISSTQTERLLGDPAPTGMAGTHTGCLHTSFPWHAPARHSACVQVSSHFFAMEKYRL